MRDGTPRDPYFGCELTLRTSVRGKELWAYNLNHVAWLRSFIAAGLRERKTNANASLSSRLPKWMLSAKNRDDVIHALGRLERQVTDK